MRPPGAAATMHTPAILAATLAVALVPAPAFASAVNNFNPTEGFLAGGVKAGKHQLDMHLTAQTGAAGTYALYPSLGFAAGLGHDWELGMVTQVNSVGYGTPKVESTVDAYSGYLHGPICSLGDAVKLGIVVGANYPQRAGLPYQVGGEGILEVDVLGAAIGLNSGYLQDFTASTGQLYENINIGGTWGNWLPYAEVGADIYRNGTPTDMVGRVDMGYQVDEDMVLDANFAVFYPSMALGPSVGFTVTF